MNEKDLNENEQNKKEDINKDSHLEEIENTNDLASEKFGLEQEEAEIDINKQEDKNELAQIEFELQKLEIKQDEIEIHLTSEEMVDKYYDEYESVKKQIKELNKKKKALLKEKKEAEPKSAIDQIQPWIIFYGVVMIILCLPGVSYSLWLSFANWLLDVFSNFFDKFNANTWLYYPIVGLLVYSAPLLLMLLSWELYINFVKKKVNKILFLVIWIIQAILTLAMMIYVGTVIFGA